MQGKLIQLMAAQRQQFALLLAILQDRRRLRAEGERVANLRRQLVQRGGNIPHQLGVRQIAAVAVGWQHINMHQRRRTAVPHRRFVLNRAVANGDNQIRLFQQAISGLIVKQPDAAGKA